ncbi:MAG: NAD(P)-dependent oxidoreductase [Deltaproteobacteria bacterium]|nr:NAD(P)-dependent oxidoreductase [Deltaproteobacteria bacterium]
MAKAKSIALIGGAGFIGHNLAIHLKEHGHQPYIIDSLGVNNILSFSSAENEIANKSFYRNLLRARLTLLEEYDIPVIVQDAREYHQLCHLIDKIEPDVIILLAAVAHADRSNKDPYNTFDHSLRTLENSLDLARSRTNHFIFFSSSMVYGNFISGEVTEDTVCSPLGIYGALKYAGEKIVIAYNQVFSLNYTIVRPSALYGERCVSRRVGQIFVENALNNIDITVNGDGSDRLDFTYIDDLTQGLRLVIENDNSHNQTFNLTYGESRSMSELALVVQEYFPQLNIHYKERDRLMPDRGTLSVEKAKRLLGYSPQFPIEAGFKKYIQWYKSL